jgi:hypothetical protein
MITLFLSLFFSTAFLIGKTDVRVKLHNKTPFRIELLSQSEFNVIMPPVSISAGEAGMWTCASELNSSTTIVTYNDACGVEYQIGGSLLCVTLKLSNAAGMKSCDVVPFRCEGAVDEERLRPHDYDRRRHRHDDLKTCQPLVDCRWEQSFGAIFSARCTRAAQQRQESY